jgi:hypothetical protein
VKGIFIAPPALKQVQSPNVKYQTLNVRNNLSRSKGRHSRESGNPEKYWIPGQARNDKLDKTYVVTYSYLQFEVWT